eukprot:6211729-Pleurochrysis_carterae.AAC.2
MRRWWDQGAKPVPASLPRRRVAASSNSPRQAPARPRPPPARTTHTEAEPQGDEAGILRNMLRLTMLRLEALTSDESQPLAVVARTECV